jgi:hypothetical protein
MNNQRHSPRWPISLFYHLARPLDGRYSKANSRRSTLDTRCCRNCDPANSSLFHNLARPLNIRKSDASSTPTLDSNAPRSTVECSTLDSNTRCCRHCNTANSPSFHHLARPLDSRQSDAGSIQGQEVSSPFRIDICVPS